MLKYKNQIEFIRSISIKKINNFNVAAIYL